MFVVPDPNSSDLTFEQQKVLRELALATDREEHERALTEAMVLLSFDMSKVQSDTDLDRCFAFESAIYNIAQ